MFSTMASISFFSLFFCFAEQYLYLTYMNYKINNRQNNVTQFSNYVSYVCNIFSWTDNFCMMCVSKHISYKSIGRLNCFQNKAWHQRHSTSFNQFMITKSPRRISVMPNKTGNIPNSNIKCTFEYMNCFVE